MGGNVGALEVEVAAGGELSEETKVDGGLNREFQ